MKRNVLILLVCFVASMAMNVVAQEREQLPQFPGGDTELMSFVAQNLVYPEQAIKDKVQGRVIVEMVIETTGEVVDVHIPHAEQARERGILLGIPPAVLCEHVFRLDGVIQMRLLAATALGVLQPYPLALGDA